MASSALAFAAPLPRASKQGNSQVTLDLHRVRLLEMQRASLRFCMVAVCALEELAGARHRRPPSPTRHPPRGPIPLVNGMKEFPELWPHDARDVPCCRRACRKPRVEPSISRPGLDGSRSIRRERKAAPPSGEDGAVRRAHCLVRSSRRSTGPCCQSPAGSVGQRII